MGKYSSSYWNKSQLRDRGWTETGIRRFLKHPDEYDENANYYGNPKGWYLKTRVQRIGFSNEYLDWVEKNMNRRKSSRKGVETKVANLLGEIEGWSIDIEKMEADALLNEAIKHSIKQSQCRNVNVRSPILVQIDHELLMVNYLRYLCLCNKGIMKRLYRRIGKHKALIRLNEKVCTAIANHYPNLSNVAEMQKKHKVDCIWRITNVK